MPVERRSLSSRSAFEAARDPEIGDEPTNSTKCSEATDNVARQSEGIASFPLLFAVRQDLPQRRALDGLAALPGQWWGSGCRWANLCGHREVRRGEVAGRTDGGISKEEVT